MTDAVTFTNRTRCCTRLYRALGLSSSPSHCQVSARVCNCSLAECVSSSVLLRSLSCSLCVVWCCRACLATPFCVVARVLPCCPAVCTAYVLHHSPGSGSLKQRAATIISAAAGPPAHTHNQVDCSALFAFCVSVRASFVCIVARCCCLVVCIVSVHPSHLTFPTFCVLVAATRQLRQGVGTMQHSATAAVATPTTTSEATLLCTALHWRRAPALQLHCDLW